jgi:hypothetical protein
MHEKVFKIEVKPGAGWVMPIIQTTEEVESRRITAPSHPRQIVCETHLEKTHHNKKGTGGVTQFEGPEFKSQY